MEKISVDTSQLVSRAAKFNAIVAPLERISGKLNGRGRSDCIRAFDENPEGFRLCATQALIQARRRGYANPLGLLVKMVRDGQHQIPAAGENGNGSAVCPSCERGGGHHLEDCELYVGSRNRQELAE